MISPKFDAIMKQVGPDGLTGYQRRARTCIKNKLAKDPDAMKKHAQKMLQTMGPDGLKKRGQAIRDSLIANGTMETRNANATAALRAKMQPLSGRKALTRYRNKVASLSRKQDLSDLPNFHLWGERGGFELDHKFSVSEGWKRQISPEILAKKGNLRFISKQENLRKSGRCVITLEELLAC